jgi:hypothetical protein
MGRQTNPQLDEPIPSHSCAMGQKTLQQPSNVAPRLCLHYIQACWGFRIGSKPWMLSKMMNAAAEPATGKQTICGWHVIFLFWKAMHVILGKND